MRQYHLQDGKCCYSKIPFELKDYSSLRSMALKTTGTNEFILVCKAFVDSEQDLVDFLQEVVSSNQYVRMETKIVHEAGQLPFRKRTSDAGYDVHSVEHIIIAPGTSASVDTGIIVSPPEGAYFTIEGRSSVFAAGVTPYRGIVDGTYQGPLKVILMNNSSKSYEVRPTDRIAQLVLHPIVHGDFIKIDEFTPIENGRMDNGWGSSGK
jgi:dUTP pyrophosphatase